MVMVMDLFLVVSAVSGCKLERRASRSEWADVSSRSRRIYTNWNRYTRWVRTEEVSTTRHEALQEVV